MAAVLTQGIDERHLRPGGTVSGPTMFAIADCAFYVAVLAMIGREPLTVTTTLTINFLRKPAAADLRAEARILKLGRTLATGDVLVYSAGAPDPVAHAAVREPRDLARGHPHRRRRDVGRCRGTRPGHGGPQPQPAPARQRAGREGS